MLKSELPHEAPNPVSKKAAQRDRRIMKVHAAERHAACSAASA
jgi:hypothetical protein